MITNGNSRGSHCLDLRRLPEANQRTPGHCQLGLLHHMLQGRRQLDKVLPVHPQVQKPSKINDFSLDL